MKYRLVDLGEEIFIVESSVKSYEDFLAEEESEYREEYGDECEEYYDEYEELAYERFVDNVYENALDIHQVLNLLNNCSEEEKDE